MQMTTDDDHLLEWVAELSAPPARDEFDEEPPEYIDRGAGVDWEESGHVSGRHGE
jgi:hypothetical protein